MGETTEVWVSPWQVKHVSKKLVEPSVNAEQILNEEERREQQEDRQAQQETIRNELSLSFGNQRKKKRKALTEVEKAEADEKKAQRAMEKALKNAATLAQTVENHDPVPLKNRHKVNSFLPRPTVKDVTGINRHVNDCTRDQLLDTIRSLECKLALSEVEVRSLRKLNSTMANRINYLTIEKNKIEAHLNTEIVKVIGQKTKVLEALRDCNEELSKAKGKLIKYEQEDKHGQ